MSQTSLFGEEPKLRFVLHSVNQAFHVEVCDTTRPLDAKLSPKPGVPVARGMLFMMTLLCDFLNKNPELAAAAVKKDART